MIKNKSQTFKLKPTDKIDYKQVNLLKSFLTEYGKIRSRRSTKLTLRQQRQLSKAIKRARYIRVIPLVLSPENLKQKTIVPKKILNKKRL